MVMSETKWDFLELGLDLLEVKFYKYFQKDEVQSQTSGLRYVRWEQNNVIHYN